MVAVWAARIVLSVHQSLRRFQKKAGGLLWMLLPEALCRGWEAATNKTKNKK